MEMGAASYAAVELSDRAVVDEAQNTAIRTAKICFTLLIGQNGGPARMRKKFIGKPVVLFVQTNGIAGEFVVKTAFQLIRLVEAWI
jgi:hypothetical protein